MNTTYERVGPWLATRVKKEVPGRWDLLREMGAPSWLCGETQQLEAVSPVLVNFATALSSPLGMQSEGALREVIELAKPIAASVQLNYTAEVVRITAQISTTTRQWLPRLLTAIGREDCAALARTIPDIRDEASLYESVNLALDIAQKLGNPVKWRATAKTLSQATLFQGIGSALGAIRGLQRIYELEFSPAAVLQELPNFFRCTDALFVAVCTIPETLPEVEREGLALFRELTAPTVPRFERECAGIQRQLDAHRARES